VHLLDNPAWHALTGPQATVAEGTSNARRYQPAFTPFAALPDNVDGDAWEAMRSLVGARGVAVLFRPPLAAPPEWEELFAFPTLQMVDDGVAAAPAERTALLGGADVADMQALVEVTHPGPFSARTVELGPYLGVRDGGTGALVAMAGVRMHAPGYREISAVCTDPGHQGRGLAGALVRDLVGRIRADGDMPILHVLADNTSAIRLYEALGFTVRAQFDVIGWRAPS
jgi:ribosomal protein S18 acetylase RimI-like enzyme